MIEVVLQVSPIKCSYKIVQIDRLQHLNEVITTLDLQSIQYREFTLE